MRGKRILIKPVDDYCDLKKGEFIMPTVIKPGTLHEKCGAVEYKMPRAMAKEYLKNRSGDDLKMRPNDYLVKVVNENFGLLHKCVRVIQY